MKASSQMVLYVPTSFNYCFCVTWGNRKPKVASFYLNTEICFASRHRKHVHIITSKPPFILTRISHMHNSFLLSYGPNRPELNLINYKMYGVYTSVNMSTSTKIDEIKQRLVEL